MATTGYPAFSNTENHPYTGDAGNFHQGPLPSVVVCLPVQSPFHNAVSMIVIDPASRKLKIPMDFIEETRAHYRTSIPSLCMLYLAGRCRQGAQCHQVHADPFIVRQLREEAQQHLMCCAYHGDTSNLHAKCEGYHLKFQGGSGYPIPIQRFARTQGLARLIDENEQHRATTTKGGMRNGFEGGEERERTTCMPGPVIIVTVAMICRLHGQDRCRFNEDCKFLHLCKDVLWKELAASQMPTTPPKRYPPPPFFASHDVIGGIAPLQEGLIAMDFSAMTPPLTPTMTPQSQVTALNTPSPNASIVLTRLGDSWTYEVYNWNPFSVMSEA